MCTSEDGLTSHPGGVEILLTPSCYRNWDKLRPDRPLGLHVYIKANWNNFVLNQRPILLAFLSGKLWSKKNFKELKDS